MSAAVARRTLPRVRRDPNTPYRLADLMAVDPSKVGLMEMADFARRRLRLSTWLPAEQERLETAGLMTADAPQVAAWRERLREYEALDRLAPELTDGESVE